jgi:hypothetical protein
MGRPKSFPVPHDQGNVRIESKTRRVLTARQTKGDRLAEEFE